MKIMQLTKGGVCFVDDEDYPQLSVHKWHLTANGRYAARRLHVYENVSKPIVYMHNEIMQPSAGFVTDHKNKDTLDNRRSNLRVVTQHQNTIGRRGTNRYRGVVQRKDKWIAQIKVKYKEINLGVYTTPEQAALAYNKAASEYFGEFAVLNIVEGL